MCVCVCVHMLCAWPGVCVCACMCMRFRSCEWQILHIRKRFILPLFFSLPMPCGARWDDNSPHPHPPDSDWGATPPLSPSRNAQQAGAIVMQLAPRVAAWAEGMLDPKAVGPFETWSSLEPTLEPLLGTSVRTFLEWTAANSDAVGAGANELTITL